jgi:hypothetical protein
MSSQQSPQVVPFGENVRQVKSDEPSEQNHFLLPKDEGYSSSWFVHFPWGNNQSEIHKKSTIT